MLWPMITCGASPRPRRTSINWITTLTLSSISRSPNLVGLGSGLGTLLSP